MQHAMQTIQQEGQTPVVKDEQPAHAHVHAHSILAAFGDQTVEEKRMQCVWRMAVGDGRLTAGQLEEEIRYAQKLATEVDKTNGFKPKENAKGQEKYGPKRASMNTIGSSIRQVWGALTHCGLGSERTSDGLPKEPALKQSTGFAFAVKRSREALKQHNIDWRGAPLPSDEQKQQNAAARLQQDEMDKYASEFPMRAGETIAAFQERQRQAVEIRLVNSTKEREEKLVSDMAGEVWQSLGPELASMVADMLYDKWNKYAEEEAKKAQATPAPEGE